MKFLLSFFLLVTVTNALAVPTAKLPKTVTVKNDSGNINIYKLHKDMNILKGNNLEEGLGVYSYMNHGVYKEEGSTLGTLAENFEYCIYEDISESCFLIKKGTGYVVGTSGLKSDQSVIVNGFYIILFDGNHIIKK